MRTVQTVTDELVRLRYVLRSESGALTRNASRRLWRVNVWAFELKLRNPRRAVFQAQQYRLFAQRSFIVVPPGEARHYERYSQSMARWGIGLATFDMTTGEFRVCKAGRSSSPMSRHHRLYALFQLLGHG